MGFDLSIEADYGAEKLLNIHPAGYLTGGKAVFAFLSGLSLYCRVPPQSSTNSLQHVYAWYQQLDRLHQPPLGVSCRELLDSLWGDSGDETRYNEDEYEFFHQRLQKSGAQPPTEAEFLAMVRNYDQHWQPIAAVMSGVRILLDRFSRDDRKPLEGFYRPDDTIPDFEALLSNLELLASRGREEVRLNFR
jgi:hypothetical protein